MENKEKSIKELLEIMLENIDLLSTGLCNLISDIYWSSEKITDDEYDIIHDYILHNRPFKLSSISAFKTRNSYYYWKKGNKALRIKWLKKHIKLNS